MSVENLKKYGKLCSENEEVRHKAKEIGINDFEGQMAHAKTLGLDFSIEDMQALAKEAGIDVKNELSEEDLKKVAGGFLTSTAAILAAIAVGLGSASAAAMGGAALATKPGW
jgi:predicted ribosomally synthesized peptide with nif11-like leader